MCYITLKAILVKLKAKDTKNVWGEVMECRKKLLEEINKYEIISFDIFDTLLNRVVCDPEVVFDIVGMNLGIENYRHIRMLNQNEASRKFEQKNIKPHANYDDIFDYMQEKTNFSKSTIQQLKIEEVEIEKKVLYRNQYMYEIFEYAKSIGKRVIIVSDMYYQKKEIEYLLEINGITGFDSLYLSSEINATKYIGDIYNFVIEREKTDSKSILHIGDNYVSDVQNAEKMGISAFYYDRSKEIKNIYGEFTDRILNGLHKGTINKVSAESKNVSNWYNIGLSVGGPIYLALINEFLKKYANRKIFALSRDGYILQYLNKELNLGLDIEYLYVSRRATLLAGISDLNETTIKDLPPFTFGQTVNEVLEYINFSELDDDAINKVGLNRYQRIKTHNDIEKFKKIYLNNKELFYNIIKKERDAAKLYFDSMKIDNYKDALFFDTGWSGTSQVLLDKTFKSLNYNIDLEFLYLGILNSTKSISQLCDKKYDTILFDIDKNIDLGERFRTSIVIPELFFTSMEPSVHNYSIEDNKSKINFENVDAKRISESMIVGIKDYVNLMLLNKSLVSIELNAIDSISPLLDLMENPKGTEAKEIGELYNFDSFANEKKRKKYLAKIDLLSLIKNPMIEVYWIQGLMVRDDVSWIVKYIIAKRENYRDDNKKALKIPSKFCDIARLINRSKSVIQHEGIKVFLQKAKKKLNSESCDQYGLWIKENEITRNDYDNYDYCPLISVIVPVYNVKKDYLEQCINSVLNQSYKNWELCMADDASTFAEVHGVLKKYEGHDKVKIHYRETNGHIAACTNSALAMAEGEYIAFLDCDDIIVPDALMEMIKALNKDSSLDFIYSDEDKITQSGDRRHTPYFKPDWSPDTFLSIMYTCHFSLYRHSILKEIGYMRSGVDGAQDYDMTLRFTEHTNKIGHISKILYHWREIPGSLSSSTEAKPYALNAIVKAKKDALERRGIIGDVEFVDDMSQYRIIYQAPEGSKVSVIIPTKNNYDILKRCIDSLEKYTDKSLYEVILVDNGSNDTNRNKNFDLCVMHNYKYIYKDCPFNFSKLNNIAVSESKGDYLLFLNDDTEFIEDGWIGRMLGQATQNHTGAVGAKLYYPESNSIQHIGITNLRIGPSHSFIGFSDTPIYYFGRNRLDINCIAVTAACLMVSKEKFLAVGGFDENLSIAYNDVDLCFKLLKKGYHNIIRNDVKLYHHESISRGVDNLDLKKYLRLQKERSNLYEKHNDLIARDYCYNSNLTGNKVDYSLNLFEDKDKVEFYSAVTNVLYESQSNDEAVAWIDSIEYFEDYLDIKGWAFIKGIGSDYTDTNVLIRNNKNTIGYTSRKIHRPDLNIAFNDVMHGIDYAGFHARIPIESIEESEESVIGVNLQSRKGSNVIVWSDKKIIS